MPIETIAVMARKILVARRKPAAEARSSAASRAARLFIVSRNLPIGSMMSFLSRS
jgi:hypothetical protein